MSRISRFLTQYRWLTYLLVVVLSVPPALGLFDIRFPGVKQGKRANWIEEEDREKLRQARSAFNFEGFSCIVVLEHEDGFFKAARMNAIRDVVHQIEQLDNTYQVVWLGHIHQYSLFGSTPILPDTMDDADYEAVEEAVRSHPLVDGHLMSEDGRTMLIYLESWSENAHNQIRKICQQQLASQNIQARVTGVAPLHLARISGFENEHTRILYTAMFLIVGLAFVIFRGLSAILIACSGPVVGVLWTLGWLNFIGDPGNELTNLVLPVMVLIIGFTDSVHFVVHVRQERVQLEQNYFSSLQNPDGQRLSSVEFAKSCLKTTAATAIDHVGKACLLTSITTAIGFASLMIADAQIVHDFGRASAIGVCLTFVAVSLVVPLLSASWLGKRIHAGMDRDLVGRHIRRVSTVTDAIIRRKVLVSGTAIALTALLTWKAMSLIPDDRLAHRVPNSSEAYQAMLHVEEAVGGTRFAQVRIDWEGDVSADEIWAVLRRTEAVILAEPLFAKPMSVRNWLTLFPGAEGPKKLHMARMAPKFLRQIFYQPENKRMQLVTRIRDLGIATYEPLIDRFHEQFAEITREHPKFKFSVAAVVFATSGFVKNVVDELFRSLFLAAIIIFFVIAIAYRSLRLGLLSVIPNLFPLVATGAIRSIIDTSLDVSSACSFAICLGIAVDDTIHFLTRYEHERRAGHSVDDAIRRTFITVGSALVMTTVVMVSGFLTVMTSSLPTHSLFGAMATSTIATALFGDLIILPALLAWFPGKELAQQGSIDER